MARFSGWPWLATQTLRLVAKEGLQWARRIKRLLSPGAPLHDLLCLRQDDNTSVPALRQGLLPGARRVQRGRPAPLRRVPEPAERGALGHGLSHIAFRAPRRERPGALAADQAAVAAG